MRFSIVKPWLLPFLYYGLLIGLSSIPHLQLNQPGDEMPLDKVCHLLAYGGLGFLLARTGVSWGLVIVVGAALGGLDEIYQLSVPGRSCDWHDWAADIVGVIMGMGSWYFLRRFFFTKAKA